VGPGRIEEDRVDGALAVVTVHGEHDLNTATALHEKLQSAVDGGLDLVVDLSPATFIDSSVLKVILEVRGHAGDAGTGFAVAMTGEGEPAVRRVLEVTGLLDRLPVLTDRDRAIEAARSGPGS
jgi:anti-anti-sigma factor